MRLEFAVTPLGAGTSATTSKHTPAKELRVPETFANQVQQIVKVIEIVLLLPCGKKQKRQFKTEAEACDYLTITHATEAPLSFTYGDGSPVLSPALERIYDRVFKELL